MSGIKTLHILPDDNAPYIELCNHYLKYFNQSKFDSTVLYFIGYKNLDTRNQTNVEKIIFWELHGTSLTLTYENLTRFYELMKNKKYDVVVCHSHASLMMACLVSILIPTYKIIGISYKKGDFSSWFKNILIFLCKKRVRLLGVLKSIRLDIRKNLKTMMPAGYIHTSHLSLDYKKIRDARLSKENAKIKLNIKSGHFIIGVKHESGVDLDIVSILTAFSYARKKIKHGVLVVFCERKHQKVIYEQAKALFIESAVVFKYELNSFSDYFRAFECIILTCNQDKMSVSLLQSMASGLPVITPDSPASIEYIGNAGYLYDSEDAYQLTHYLELIYKMSPEKKMRLKTKIFAQINKHYTAKVCREKFLALPKVKEFLYKDLKKK